MVLLLPITHYISSFGGDQPLNIQQSVAGLLVDVANVVQIAIQTRSQLLEVIQLTISACFWTLGESCSGQRAPRREARTAGPPRANLIIFTVR